MRGWCLGWAWKRMNKNPGSYMAMRWSRMNRIPLLKWPHFLWKPKNCPDHGKPCPYMLSFVPDDLIVRTIPPLIFKGHVKAGDGEAEKGES